MNKIRGSSQIQDSTIQIAAIDIATSGKALITNVIAGDGVVITETGADTGTGGVTVGINETFGSRVLAMGLVEKDVSVAVRNGTIGIPITPEISGFDIEYIGAFVNEKGITGTTNIQVVRKRSGNNVNVLSTEITLGDEWYVADGVINTSNDDLATGDMLFINVTGIHSGTAPTGLTVAIVARLP